MSLDRIAEVAVSIQRPPLGVADFGTALLAVILSGPQNTAWEAEYGASVDVIELAQADWQTAFTALGILTTDDAYRDLVDFFSQDEEPDKVLVGRRATPVAQVVEVDIVGTDDGDYVVTINGVDFTFAASGDTGSDIEAGLISLVNAGSEPVTASPGTGDQLLLTADEAGVPFVVSVSAPSDNLETTTATANVGLPEDIAAWRAERDDWWLLLETTRSSGNIRAAGEVIDALPVDKFFNAQTDDSNAQNGGSTSDLASVLGPTGLNLQRTALWYHDTTNGALGDDDFVDAAIAGRMLPTPAGEAIPWHHKQLTSVVGILPTSESTLVTKHYNWLEAFRAAGRTATQQGQAVSGQWIDLIRGRDFLKALVQLRCFEALTNNDVVPYTDLGAQILGAAIRGAMLECPMIQPDTIVVNIPRASTQGAEDRGNRHWSGITFHGNLRGAVNTLSINGFLVS